MVFKVIPFARQIVRVTTSIRHPRDMRRYRFLDASGQGWYHNVDLDGVRAWSLFGTRKNSPLLDHLGHDALFDEFCEIWQGRQRASKVNCLKGLNVLDIGPAEGFFSLAAISAGARRVRAINPPSQLTERFKKLIHFHQLQDRIEIKEGYFPQIGGEMVQSADLIFALGVIYHAENCESFVDALTTSRKPLWVEVMSSLDQIDSFDPINHFNRPFFSHAWLEGTLEKRGYELAHCSTYNSRCLTNGYLHPNANGLWTRRAFVAFPSK